MPKQVSEQRIDRRFLATAAVASPIAGSGSGSSGGGSGMIIHELGGSWHSVTQPLDMQGQAITNVGAVDGVDISAHIADPQAHLRLANEWEYVGSIKIDANYPTDSVVTIANDNTGRADLIVDRHIILSVDSLVDGVDLSALSSAYTAHLSADSHTNYLLASGARALTGDWDIGAGRFIQGDKFRARGASGLRLETSAGGLGLVVESSGQTSVGALVAGISAKVVTASGAAVFTADGATNAQLILDRNANTNIAAINWRTNAADYWIAGLGVYRSASDDLQIGTGTTEFITLQASTGHVGIGTVINPLATLSLGRGTGSDGTLAVFGTAHHSYFNLSTAEDTYIRGGKTGADVHLNDSHAGDVLLTGGGGVTYISNDADRITYIGRSAVGYGGGYADYAYFGHRDVAGSAGNYAVLQADNGQTYVNATSGQFVTYAINHDPIFHHNADRVFPAGTILKDLGNYNRKWRTLYAAELYVETLVAQYVLATIGGRVMVAPTTSLIADMTDSQTTIDVKHNNLHSGSGVGVSGHYIFLETAPGGIAQVEAMKIGDGFDPVAITGGWRYTVYRGTVNGLDGTPRNAWLSGDAVVSLGGQVGQGYIDLTSTSTIHNHIGPNMTIYVRTGTTLWNEVKPVVSLGNLDNWVDYSGTQQGIAIGNDLLLTPTTGFRGITADNATGIRLFSVGLKSYNGSTQTANLDPADGSLKLGSNVASATTTTLDFAGSTGALRVGPLGTNLPNLYWDGTLLQLRSNTTAAITLDSSGGSYFSGVMTIGTSGEIRQGTGTLGTDFTGLRIWRESNVGRIAGYNNNIAQWHANTDGKLYAGGGAVQIDVNGVNFEAGNGAVGDPNGITWRRFGTTNIDAYVLAFSESGTSSTEMWTSLRASSNSAYRWLFGGGEKMTLDGDGHLTVLSGRVGAGTVRAIGSGGLRLEDDAGILGVFVEDGGQVGIGTNAPAATLEVEQSSGIASIYIDSGEHGQFLVTRASTAKFAAMSFRTLATDNWHIATGVYRSGSDLQIGDASAERLTLTASTINLGFRTSNQFGGGSGVIGIANRTTAPSFNPSAGGVLYAESGAGKWRGSSGTVTTFANADPHCPVCGADYMKEFDNAEYGYFAICLPCLANEIGERPWIIKEKSRLN